MNDTLFDEMTRTAREAGAYHAIAQMMRDNIRKLEEADDEWSREWAVRSLVSLAEQLEETEEKFKKEVDNFDN
jgi:hypothetical protein